MSATILTMPGAWFTRSNKPLSLWIISGAVSLSAKSSAACNLLSISTPREVAFRYPSSTISAVMLIIPGA
ncbi:MAG: hypothetical protein KDC85_16510 [Saprospiraceae bacterium]|nr:hypothetical protein [Saprospiraceae bacterium]MCB9322182.1 hypothetical protein [Lewinellaceae bacterium]